MRVLVTGGAGFIGANLAAHLQQQDDDVVVLDDLSSGEIANLDGVDVTFVEGSILDADLLSKLVADVDAIVHLAARPSVPRSLDDPMASHQANATGTLMVLDAARSHGNVHVVLASSSSVYGANPILPKSEDLRAEPMSPYAVSKLAAEQYALSHQACFGLPVLPFRFFNVFGPLQAPGHAYAAVVPAFVDAALRGMALQVNGDGLQSRDFTYVGTVVEVLADSVARRVTTATPVNLAFGGRMTLLELIAMLEDILGRSLPVEHDAERPGDVRHSQADKSLLSGLFPDVSPVSIRQGLRDTVAWLSQRTG